MAVAEALKNAFALQWLEEFGTSLLTPVFLFFALEELKLSASQGGALISGFALAQSVGAPFVGRISDAWGRRGPFLVCFLWTSFWYGATSSVSTYSGLMFYRVMAGLYGGSIPIVQSMIMDTTDRHERPVVLGLYGAVLGSAFFMGPLVMTVILTVWSSYNRRYVFLAASALSALAAVLGFGLVQETLPVERRRPFGAARTLQAPTTEPVDHPSAGGCRWRFPGTGMLHDICTLCNRDLAMIWGARFFSDFSFTCLLSTYAFLVKDAFVWDDTRLGIGLVTGGVVMALVQWKVYPFLSQRVGKYMCFVFGAIVSTVVFPCLAVCAFVAHSVGLHAVMGLLLVTGKGLMDPCLPDLASLHAPSDSDGLVQGVLNCFKTLAAVLGPICAGRAYEKSPSSPYWMASVAVMTSGFCILQVMPASRGKAGERLALIEKLTGRLEHGESEPLTVHKRGPSVP